MNDSQLKEFLEARMTASDRLVEEKFKGTQIALELQSKENERRFNGLDDSVGKIMTNHIPHIQSQVDALKTNIAYYVGGLAAIGFILQLVLAYYKK